MSIDDVYGRLRADQAHREAEEATARARAAAEEESRRRTRMNALVRARDQVFGTTDVVVRNSRFSGILKTRYCKECPCISVTRKDENGLAAQVEIEVDSGGLALMKLGELGWVDVGSNAPALREYLSAVIAEDLLKRPMQASPLERKLEKYALWAVLAIPIGFVVVNLAIGLLQAAGSILLIVVVCAIGFGLLGKLTS